tara:strand:- start:309 stop:578 length:270 start_codon:yes stop_codon:yes gene_type:complete
MSDFKEMLFSETIKPKNWQELQAEDEAMQKEMDEQLLSDINDAQLKQEMDEVKREQIKQDNQEMYDASIYHEMKESGMDFSDFYSGSTF